MISLGSATCLGSGNCTSPNPGRSLGLAWPHLILPKENLSSGPKEHRIRHYEHQVVWWLRNLPPSLFSTSLSKRNSDLMGLCPEVFPTMAIKFLPHYRFQSMLCPLPEPNPSPMHSARSDPWIQVHQIFASPSLRIGDVACRAQHMMEMGGLLVWKFLRI